MNKAVKIPANPSFVELKEDDNAVEKFKKAMYSISNILALDKLKQVGGIGGGAARACGVVGFTLVLLVLP